MGTTSQTLVACALLAAAAADAHADTCTGTTSEGGLFAKCFDLGNRLSVTTGSDGVGVSVKLRHLIRFDDEPDLVWKLEHGIADVTYGGWEQRLDGALYRGRFLRHARDGHIVLPFGIPKKIFLPFDIGAEAAVATVKWRPLKPPEEQVQMGVVKIAALVDFSRTRSFKRRFALGPVVRWDIDVDRSMGRLGSVSEHMVSPFTMGMLNLHAESKDGLWLGDLRAEAGTAWHTNGGWKTQAEVEASLERIVIAINDRPVAITAGASYATATDEAIARIGARIVLVHRNDKRVNLRPLAEKRMPPAPRPAPSSKSAPPARPVTPPAPPVTPPARPVTPPAPPVTTPAPPVTPPAPIPSAPPAPMSPTPPPQSLEPSTAPAPPPEPPAPPTPAPEPSPAPPTGLPVPASSIAPASIPRATAPRASTPASSTEPAAKSDANTRSMRRVPIVWRI